jgi:hypothetical protein
MKDFKNGSIERTELKYIDHIPFLSALIFWSIILAASRNMSHNLNVGKTAHPHSRKSFIRGARCASNKEFSMATEKTIIKDSKSNGGIVGLARKKSALIRWTITRHIVGHFSAVMKVRSGLLTADDETHDENRSALKNSRLTYRQSRTNKCFEQSITRTDWF